ncbi:MAG: 2-polyprenylphenol 6-hydroxylase [Alphaproteobacteria bacterium]
MLGYGPWPRRLARLALPGPRAAARGLRRGQRLVAALEALGPAFIKFGQTLSTRPDLVGDAFAEDLASLRDRLAPFPGEAAVEVIETAFDCALESLFAEFDQTPVAAASIAQVHYALTADGRAVAVKVLRPGIERAFGRDIELFRWLARIAAATQPTMRRLKPVEVVDKFAETSYREMDLSLEAAAASELGQNFVDDPTYQVPEVDWARTGPRVLTLARVEGISLGNRHALVDAGIDLDTVVTNLLAGFLHQVFRDGFFHGDMHPGNLFADIEGNILAVDFGIMGRLDQATRDYLADMLFGMLTRDYELVAEVHFRAGYVPANQSRAAFAQACRSIAEPILGKPLHEISLGRLLQQLFQITETFQMETQPQLLLLQKTLLMAEGMGRRLDPTVNMWSLAQPLIEEWMRSHRGPEARVAGLLADMLDAGQRLPRTLARLERIVETMEIGGPRSPAPRPAVASRRGVFWAAALAALAAAGWTAFFLD